MNAHHERRRTRATGLAVVVGLLLTGCGAAATGGTKAGGEADPAVTLRLGHIDGADGEPETVKAFVDAVTDASGGTLTVEVAADFKPSTSDSSADQTLVTEVADGTFDLGWAAVRGFTDLGVTAFDALSAPMLVDSYALQQAIIGSGLPQEMLDAVEPLGVEGLALMAGGLRKPLGADGPMLTPDDFAGTTFHTWNADIYRSAIEALGATVTSVPADERNSGLATGELAGMEWSLHGYASGGYAELVPHVPSNVNLWPRMSALIANPASLASLSDAQREALSTAATQTAAASTGFVDVEDVLVEEMCAVGAHVTLATPEDLAALAEAFQPVTTALEADPATADAMSRIRELASDLPDRAAPAVPAGCDGGSGGGAASPAETAYDGDPSLVDGVYRVEWTAEELEQGALIDGRQITFPPDVAENNDGIVTMTLSDGSFDLQWEGDDYSCPGSYTLSPQRISMVASDGPDWGCGPDSMGEQIVDAAWQLDGGTLTLTDFVLPDYPDQTWASALSLGGKPWTKVD